MERLTIKLDGRNAIRLGRAYGASIEAMPDFENMHLTGDVADRLAAYEDAVESGLLVACPCKVGDMAYYIRGTTIYGDTVERIVIDGLDNQIILNANRAYLFCDVGGSLFFSYAEAEAALKKRKEE